MNPDPADPPQSAAQSAASPRTSEQIAADHAKLVEGLGREPSDPPSPRAGEKQGLLQSLSVGDWAVIGSSAVALIATIILAGTFRPRERYGLIGAAGRYTSEGVLEENVAQRIYTLWTPSKETEGDVTLYYGGLANVPEYYRFTEARKKEWEDGLMALGATGYTFYPVTGRGSGPLKRGYYWEVTMDSAILSARSPLLELYGRVWKRTKGIYVQEVAPEPTAWRR